eukprot:15333894-Ditylum_brightwellii.AAC.1
MKERGSVEEFLDIKIIPTNDGIFKLTQSGLVDKLLATTGIGDYNPIKVPTHASSQLGPDHQGNDLQLQEMWNYASVVEM